MLLRHTTGRNRDMPACWRVFDGILKENAHHLTHGCRVRINCSRFVDRQSDAMVFRDQFHLAHGIIDNLC